MTLRKTILLPALLAAAGLTALPAAAQLTGLTAETWTGLTPGTSVNILRDEGISSGAPDSVQTVNSAAVTSLPANSGTRLRGTLTPPVDDTYTFWVNGADNVSLWLTEDGTRFTKQLIAQHTGATTSGQWAKYSSQKSLPVSLSANTTYHIEAHVMSGSANGHLSIAWQGRDGNWALAANGATASQSTTMYAGTVANNAIDGVTNAAWSANTLTKNLPNSWLQIDFAAVNPVDQVVLFNNTSNQNRLSNFRISVLDGQGTELAGENFFTTSGNAGNSFTWNLPAAVNGKSVKVKLLGNNLAGNGFLALAEVQAFGPGPLSLTRGFQVIPGTYLAPVTADPADANDNNLPDAWEQQTGLDASALPGALLEYGDPDYDGITNYQEQLFGSNPLVAEALGDVITRARWMGLQATQDGIPSITNGSNRQRFLGYPNDVSLEAGIDYTYVDKNSALRYRGSIIAPSTGSYRFWLAGNGDTQLWISDGSVDDPANQQPLTNRFGKQLIATSGGVNQLHDFDQAANQRSRAVSLVQGQTYYIEVLQMQAQANSSHASLAWQPPGQVRSIVPAEAFLALAPHANDADDDNLPDDWETAKNLNPADNGLTSAANGEYGDPDGDGLTNLLEFQHGTNPKAADTDGDGTSDAEEIRFYGSDPLVSNNLSPVVIDLPPINQYSASTGIWTEGSGGSLSASGRRGAITYTFAVTEPGIHEVAVAAGAISATSWYTKYLNLVLSLDDAPFARGTLSSRYGATATLRTLTPWLGAGTHTLTIFHDNVAADLRLRLDSVSFKRLGGADLNADGIPDWVAAAQAQANGLTRIPSQSRTSPLSVEGRTQLLSSTTLTALMPGAQEADGIPATESINDTFFAEVPLSADGDVTLSAVFLGGAITESHGISWIATNLFEFDQSALHIRAGDSLRLDAWGGTAADGQPFTVTLNGTHIADGNQNTTHTSGQPLAVTFPAAGTHTLVATHGGQTSTVALNVHSADFGSGHAVRVGVPRTWAPPALGADAIVEAADDLTLAETTASRTFQVGTGEAADNYAIARLPAGIEGAPSAILARGEILGFDTAQVDETGDARTIVQYPDGTWLMHSTVVAANLPEGVVIRLTAKNQGTLFSNGSTVLELRASDFDSNGIAHIYFEWSGVGDPKMCHTTSLLIEP